ncbi:MAG: tryptophan 7-halogenase, partial [Planctomycetaceae bacterium]
FIPLHDDVTSIGVVAAYDYLFKNRDTKENEAIYFEEVERCPGVKERIAGAERVAEYRAAREYSYRSTKAAGDGWVLVGDAFGFLDPLYSSGVLLALRSGEMAADAIGDALAAGDTSAKTLGRWEAGFVKGMERMRRLVCEYYDGFSFGGFVKRHPRLKGHITDLLIGDLFEEKVDDVFPPMDDMRAELGAAE